MTSKTKISFRAKYACGEKPLLKYFEKEEEEEKDGMGNEEKEKD